MLTPCAPALLLAVFPVAATPQDQDPLTGTLVPAEAAQVALWLDAYRDELLVLEAAEHGTFVNEGDVLIRFDLHLIDEQIRQAEFDLQAAEERLAEAEAEAELAAAADRDALIRTEREAEWAQRRLAGYLEREKAFRIEDVRLREQATEHGLEDQRDELEQLEQMYREDELVDATEEIVLKRARRRLAMSIARAKLRTEQTEHEMALDEALRQERLELDTNEKLEALERKRHATELAARRRERELHNTRFELHKDRERLEQLLADREALLVRAPAGGLVIHGDPEAAPGDGRLDRGSRAGLFKTIMVVADPDRLDVIVDVPEPIAVAVRGNPMARIAVPAAPEFHADGRARIAYLPTGRDGDENVYRAVIALDTRDRRLRPGMRCTVTFPEAGGDQPVAARGQGQ